MTPEERRVANAFEGYWYTLRVDETGNRTFRDRLDNRAIEFNDAIYEYMKARMASEKTTEISNQEGSPND